MTTIGRFDQQEELYYMECPHCKTTCTQEQFYKNGRPIDGSINSKCEHLEWVELKDGNPIFIFVDNPDAV